GGLFGDEGPLHFFRGPVELKRLNNSKFRIFSQLDPVPGTPENKQRLTITGLVPPAANIGTDPTNGQRQAWINNGHPVTYLRRIEQIDDRTRRQGAVSEFDDNLVVPDKNVVVGEDQGRYFLTPGEEMKVGLAADFAGFDTTAEDFDLGVLDEIEIVSRSPEDARSLATGDTEFNPI
ncbi:MAG: hypothetical protein ACI9HI_001033, partial [Salinirussus sp.]